MRWILLSILWCTLSAAEFKAPVEIALVLGGGGSKALAELGAIRELEAAGIRPDLIIGSSGGALIGALYADEPEVDEIDQILIRLRRSDLLDTKLARFGLVKGRALENFLQLNLFAQKFEELKIPLIVVATDLETGELVELSHDDIPRAVCASCAYPGIFEPVFLDGRHLIDGGIVSPLPVEIAKKYGAKIIIAIDVSEKLPSGKPSHLFGIAHRALEIAYRKFISHALAMTDIAIRMDFQDKGTFSDHMNQEMYDHGRAQAKKVIPTIQKLLGSDRSLARQSAD